MMFRLCLCSGVHSVATLLPEVKPTKQHTMSPVLLYSTFKCPFIHFLIPIFITTLLIPCCPSPSLLSPPHLCFLPLFCPFPSLLSFFPSPPLLLPPLPYPPLLLSLLLLSSSPSFSAVVFREPADQGMSPLTSPGIPHIPTPGPTVIGDSTHAHS